MIVRSGVPVKKTGDTCEMGELLVSGELHIMNDDQEVIRCEYVHADADIWIARSLSYYREFPLHYQTQEATGEQKERAFLRIGDWYLGLYGKKEKDWRIFTEEDPLYITENFKLPISFGKVSLIRYRTVNGDHTETQAKDLAVEQLCQYEKELLEKGCEILENKITIKLSKTSCIAKGTILIEEKIGKETKINTEISSNENLYLKSDGEMVQ